MAERKGGQGELQGGGEGEERREGELLGGRWVEDSGTESGEERKGVEEAVEEVKGALERLATALPRLAGNLGGSVSDLVAKLQNCLSTPAPPPRRNKRRHHTVGVTPEEIAKARKWAERPHPLQLTRCEFRPMEHKAGYFVEPLPQSATLTYAVPPISGTAPPLNYDPSVALFTPAQSVQIAVHKAAIQKQISQEESRVHRVVLQRQMSQEELRKKESDCDSSSDEEISPARRLLKLASKRRTKTAKIKRSNTVEIPRPSTYCDSDTDDLAYSSDRSDLKRKSCGALFSHPPQFLPKTDNDLKFLEFLNKVNDSSSKVITYNPSARGGKHWSNRFSRIKTAFEDQSSDEKDKEIISKGKTSPFPQLKTFIQQNNTAQSKLPWSVKQEGDVVVGSITVAKRAPGPVNQFTHAPMSAFKPVEKKTFPSSVSGSVKQLASQKFTPQPEMSKPVPSVPPRTHSKFQPLPGPENTPLSQRFVPNKMSSAQQHPPPQAYLNQFNNFSPKHLTYSNDKVPHKIPNKIQEPKQEPAPETVFKPNHPARINTDFHHQDPFDDFSNWKSRHQLKDQKQKPETLPKPLINYSQPVQIVNSNFHAQDSTSDYNSNWASQDLNQMKSTLSPPDKREDSNSLSPHPYKGCYVYNENNEILSNSPYLSTNSNIHIPVSPSYKEPIYENISEVRQSQNILRTHDSVDKPLPSFKHTGIAHDLSVNGRKTPEKSPMPQQFPDSRTFFPKDHAYGENSAKYNSIQNQRLVSSSPKFNGTVSIAPYGQGTNAPSIYNPLSPGIKPYQSQNDDEIKNISQYYLDSRKGSHDSLNEYLHRGDYSPDYNAGKSSPHVVFNNCSNGARASERKSLNSSYEGIDRLSPGFNNISGVNSGGDSPRGCEEWDSCIEEKAVVGRVMGEAQCQRAVTQRPRIETRFPNAPTTTNLLRPPPDQPKIPSPTSRSRQDHSPKALSPSFPNVLLKSESWHQMVKEQMMQAKQAPPLPKVVKTKSSHTLALPKQFEGSLNPDALPRMQSTVSQYFAKSSSPQKSKTSQSDNSLARADDIENVDEAFESIFQECNKKRNSK